MQLLRTASMENGTGPDELIEYLTGRRPVIKGGGFNVWEEEWGRRCTDTRGYSQLEAIAKLEVKLANEGTSGLFAYTVVTPFSTIPSAVRR